MMQKHFSILAAALCTAAFFGGMSECSAALATQYDNQEMNKLIENMKESLAKQKEQIEISNILLKKIEAKVTNPQESTPLAGAIPPAPPMAGTETSKSQSNTPKSGVAIPPPPSLVPPPPANVPPPPVLKPGVTTAKKGSTDLQSAIRNAKLNKTTTETKPADKAPGSFVNDIAAGKKNLKKSSHQRTASAPAAFGGVDNELAKAIAKRRQKVESQQK